MSALREKAPLAADDDSRMRHVAVRDATVFAEIVHAHAPMLHRVAYRMIADATEAEDVTQEALLRLWRYAVSWRPGGPGIAPWLTRVTVNLCIDRLRRRRFVHEGDARETADGTIAADIRIDNERARARTVAAIATLSPRHRAAIVLTYYEELPNVMAAAALDLNIKAFESLLLRARAALRVKLVAAGVDAAALEL